MGAYSGIPPSPTFDSATIDGNFTVNGTTQLAAVNTSGDVISNGNSSFNSVTTTGAAVVGSLLLVGGDLDHNGANVGFYGTAPVAQGLAVADAAGGVTVDVEARTALNALLARIRATGLIAT